MILTAGQRAAIEHRGSNLLVAASAGAGKTEVLARRCLALVADPCQPCDIDRMLVVTFTRAAAAELRVRIARMLREAARQARSGELRRHLRRQELLVEAADIGTIDAWCGRIVREHFAEAGVDVRFTTLSEQDARLLRVQVLDELCEGIARGTEPLAAEARAWMARSAVPDDRFLREAITRLNTFREHLVNPESWFQRVSHAAGDDEQVLAAALGEECSFQHHELSSLLVTSTTDELRRTLQPYYDRLGIWQRRLAEPGWLMDTLADMAAFKLAGPRGGAEPPELAEVRQRWLAGRLQQRWSPDAISSILDHGSATAELVATLLRLEARYHEMLTTAKRQRGAYEFADVLRLALDVLGRPTTAAQRQPSEVARRLQQRYEHILVDEYQDTSPVQVEILRLVTRDGPGQSNRFMVGDVKQSIYGFREAEPRLFVELADAFEQGRAEGRVQYLSDNFRSHARLLAALNKLFARLFDRRLGGTAYGEREWLRAGREAGEIANPTLDEGPRIEVHVVELPRGRHPANESEADEAEPVEVIEREAQLAAEQIRWLLQSGVEIPGCGSDGRPELRPLRLADIVILLRSAVRAAGQVARVLRDNGIPCVTSGRESMLDVVEVRDVCTVLELLVNRRQDVPLAAYLRSPLVGLTEAELLQLRSACRTPGADFYDAVEEFRRSRLQAALAARLDAAMAQLDRWVRVAREEALPALLRRIFQDTGLPLLAAALEDGPQRVALLQALTHFAQAFAAAGPGSAAEFVEYLRTLEAEEIEPAALAAGHEDAVRISTIHRAKGLEFPVVFLLGAGTRFNADSQRMAVQCDADLGLGLKFTDYPARTTLVSARHHVISQRLRQRELEEELRLLYVAATRAREHLVIVGSAEPDTWERYRALYGGGRAPPLVSRMSVASRLEWMLMAAAGIDEATATKLIRVQTHAAAGIRPAPPGGPNFGQPGSDVGQSPRRPGSGPTLQEDAWVARGRELLGAHVGSVWCDFPAVMSVSALKERARRQPAEDRWHELDAPTEPLVAPTFARAAETHDGRELGSACHRFLELADLGRLASATDVERQVNELVAGGRLSAEHARLIPVAELVWLAGTPEGRLLAHAAHVRREVPFVYALSLGEGGEYTIVRGIIDCLIDTPEGLVVLDYKTDSVRDAADLAARLAGYEVQLRVYAQAAEAIFARPVARALLVFLLARRIVPVPSGPLLPTALLLGAGGAG